MGKLFKYLAIILAAIIVLGTIVIGSIVMFVNPNDFKDDISQQAYKATGRTLTINGDLKWSFFPRLAIEVNDANLSNAPGFNHTPFAELGHAKVTVKLMPLFSGHIEADTLTVDNLTLNLMKNAQGKNNWQDISNPKSSSKTKISHPATNTTNKTVNASKTEGPQKKDKKLTLLISNISLNNITVNWQDKQTNTHTNYTISKLQSHDINFKGDSFPIDLTAYIKQTTTGQQVTVALSSDIEINLQQQIMTLTDASFRINNLKANGHLNAHHIFSKDIAYQGEMTIPSFDARTFIRSLNRLLRPADSHAFDNIKGQVKFSGTNNTLQIPSFKIKLDDTSINGNANIKDIKKLIGNFKLNIDQINLDNYKITQVSSTHTRVANQSNKTKTANRQESSQSHKKQNHQKKGHKKQVKKPYKIPFEHASFNGEITAKQITIHKMKMQNIETLFNLQQGILAIGPVKASVYSGALRANVIADYTKTTPKYNFSETLHNVKIQSLLNDLSGDTNLSGLANINTNLTAKGKNSIHVLRSLSGSAGFSIQNGKVANLQLMQAIDTAASLFFRQPASQVKETSTAFTHTAATFSLRNGVASTDDFVLNSPLIKVTGDGTIDLVTQKLNMSLDVRTLTNNIPPVVKLQKSVGGSIPLKVKGTLSDPHISPDMNTIALRSTKEKVGKQLKKVGDDLNKTGKDLGKQLKAIFN